MSDSNKNNIINNEFLFIRVTTNDPYSLWPDTIKITNEKHAIFTNHYAFLPSQLTSQNTAIKLLNKLQKFYSENSQEDIDKINFELKIQSKQNVDRELKEMDSDFHPEKVPIQGYIYFLQAENKMVKIGKAINLKNRFDQIQPKLPFKVKNIHVIKAKNYSLAESLFHDLFDQIRFEDTEWFALTNNDIEDIKNKKLPQNILELIIEEK